MSVSWELIAPLIIMQLILMTTALISCMKAEEINGEKWVWGLIIVFVNIIGPILFFVIGKKRQ